MASLSVTNTLSNGQTIQASEHNTNYSDIVNYVNARNSGSSTWDGVSILTSSGVPFKADNSTGTSDVAQFKDNGTTVFSIADGGIITSVNQSAARVYRGTTNQTFTDNTVAKIQFNAESYDVKSEFDSATNYRFTATVAGKYLVVSAIKVTTTNSTVETIYIYVNGSAVSFTSTVSNSTNYLQLSDILTLSATDYVEMFGLFNATPDATTDINFGSDISYMAIHKIA